MSFKDSVFWRVCQAVLGLYAAVAILAIGIGIVVGILTLFGLM